MRSLLFILFLTFITKASFSQVPPTINYQGVARDASGNPVSNQTIGLQFKISTPANSNFYGETQSVPTNSFGLFSTKIGAIIPLPNSGWNSLPAILDISINVNNTGFVPLATQTLASVPYALYALNASGLPTATVNGTTLKYNATFAQWQIDTNLINTGSRVSVGKRNIIPNNKFTSVADNGLDSAAIFGFNKTATDGMAGVRGFAAGSSLISSTLNTTGIAGGHFVGYNVLGQGIGAMGQGSSFSGNGIGLLGIGSSSGTTVGSNYAVGVYGTVDPNSTSPVKYAGVFDKGNVFVRDTLQLNVSGNIGDVLTRWTNGKAVWQSPIVSSSPFTTTTNFVHLQSSVAGNKVVIGNTTPTLLGYGSKLTVYNPTGNNDTALSVIQNTTAHAIYSINKNASTTSYAGFFEGGLVSKGKNTLPTSSALLVRDVSNADLFTVRNDGFIGVNTPSPTNKLSIVGTSSSTGFPYTSSPQTKINILNNDGTDNNYSSFAFTSLSSSFGLYSSAEIVSENVTHLSGNLQGNLIFLTRDPGNINEKMRINSNGNVGIGTSAPVTKLDVAGSSKLGVNGSVMTNLIHGLVTVALTTGFIGPGISSPMNVAIPNINPGDRVIITLMPNSNTITHGICIATSAVTAANNLEVTFGALKTTTVPSSINFQINYMIIKP